MRGERRKQKRENGRRLPMKHYTTRIAPHAAHKAHLLQRQRLLLCSLLSRLVQFLPDEFPRLEMYLPASGNINRLAGQGIAGTRSWFHASDREGTETANLDAIALCQGLPHRLKYNIDSLYAMVWPASRGLAYHPGQIFSCEWHWCSLS